MYVYVNIFVDKLCMYFCINNKAYSCCYFVFIVLYSVFVINQSKTTWFIILSWCIISFWTIFFHFIHSPYAFLVLQTFHLYFVKFIFLLAYSLTFVCWWLKNRFYSLNFFQTLMRTLNSGMANNLSVIASIMFTELN